MNLNSDLVIRPMLSDDCSQVVALEESCRLSSWGVEGYERELHNSDAILLVAHCGPEFGGYFSGRMMGDDFEIFSIAVEEKVRRIGVASALLSAGLIACHVRGLRHCFLEVRAANIPAISLYERNSFEVVGRRLNYYHQPQDDALIMVRDCQITS